MKSKRSNFGDQIQFYSNYLSEQTGNKAYLKPENMQFTGAYKVRGAYYKNQHFIRRRKREGPITASAGNHAQGVAYAAKCYGCKATIVMPTTTPLIKVNRTKSYGADVVLFMEMFMMKHVHMLMNWLRSMDIPLSILLMI